MSRFLVISVVAFVVGVGCESLKKSSSCPTAGLRCQEESR
jgi:hypothetical protein